MSVSIELGREGACSSWAGLSPRHWLPARLGSIMEAMRTPSAPVLVGRERELGLLHAVLEQSLGSAAVAVVRGDAGTGKSALLARVGRDAEDKGMLVLRATGVQA